MYLFWILMWSVNITASRDDSWKLKRVVNVNAVRGPIVMVL